MSDLPDGWVETTIGEVVDYGKTEKVEPKNIPTNAWILELEDIEKDTSHLLQRLTLEQRESKSTKNAFKKDDVLYGKLRPYLNKVIVADDDGFCTTEIIPIKPNSAIDGRYLFYWLKNPEFLKYVNSVSYGLNMPRLGTKDGLAAPLVLAPLPEQKRIAEKLDQVLARVDACQSHLERVPQILKRFRQSVLAAATSGRLTEDWREENSQSKLSLPFDLLTEYEDHELPELPDTWNWQRFGDVASIDSNLVDPTNYQEFPHVAPNHIESKTGRLLPYGIIASDKVMSGNHLFRPGQIIYSKIRPYLCKAVVVDFAGLCSADMYPISGKSVSEKFLHKWMISEQFTNFASAQQGRTVLPKINQVALNKIPVPVPPSAEQAEIVRRVEKLFAFATKLEARAQAGAAHVARLTPSLLAKAFRGELVGNPKVPHF